MAAREVTPFYALESSLDDRNVAKIDLKALIPANATLWIGRQYTDLHGWHSLPNPEELAFKPSRLADGRLRFLDPVEGTAAPPEFSSMVSGKFDVKSWVKMGVLGKMIVAVEGEKLVLIKIPGVNTVVSWQSPERLPILEKTWRPIMFLINATTTAVRLTKTVVLMLTHDSENNEAVQVHSVDYNGGFCCVHPCNNIGIVSGAYCVPSLTNCLQIPSLRGTSSSWGYFLQFYSWGCLLLPKVVDVYKPSSLLSCCQEKNDTFGLLYNHPNMLICLNLKFPTTVKRVLEAGVNYAVTAMKHSETDIAIYIILDGQLLRYNYSFDLRNNRPGKPMIFPNIAFKFVLSGEEKARVSEMMKAKLPYEPKWTGAPTKDSELLIKDGCPLSNMGHLVTRETAAIFDAETGMYLAHPPSFELTKVFQPPSETEIKPPLKIKPPTPSTSVAIKTEGGATSGASPSAHTEKTEKGNEKELDQVPLQPVPTAA